MQEGVFMNLSTFASLLDEINEWSCAATVDAYVGNR